MASGDVAGAATTAAAALRAIVSDFSNMRTMNRWAERLKDGLAVGPLHAHDDDTLMVSAGLLAAANFESSSIGSRDEIERHAQSVLDAIMGDAAVRDVNVALLAAESLLEYYIHIGRRSHSEQVVLRCAAWLQDARMSPFLCARWLFWVGNTFRFLDLPDKADAHFAEARRIGAEHRFRWIEFHILRADLRTCIDRADYPLAKDLLEKMQSLLDFERPLDIGDYYYVKGWIELLEGDATAALEDFRIARDAAERGCYSVAVNFYRSMEAYALIALEDEPSAIAILEELSYASNTPRYQAVQKGTDRAGTGLACTPRRRVALSVMVAARLRGGKRAHADSVVPTTAGGRRAPCQRCARLWHRARFRAEGYQRAQPRATGFGGTRMAMADQAAYSGNLRDPAG
jgi:tetratricopeptide (TPR) repeat protein